ncbi:MAG: DUF1990 family protein [Microbacterium sp.]
MSDLLATTWEAPPPPGFRRSEVSRVIGSGAAVWERACDDILRWRVKTRSGFRVDTTHAVSAGVRLTIVARALGVSVREPVEVTAVTASELCVGFSYRTLPGHPVDGEEAFLLQRSDADASIVLTIRSLTRPAPSGLWRWVFPFLLVAQRIVRRRYLRSLR